MTAPLPALRPPPGTYAELDEVTLERARRGDRAGCRALVQRYERPVFALVGRMVVPERDCVEDLAQETFLRVFKALPRFDRNGPAKLSSTTSATTRSPARWTATPGRSSRGSTERVSPSGPR